MRISQGRSTTAPEESIPSTSGERRKNIRSNLSITYEPLAFKYNPTVDYAGDKSVDSETMDNNFSILQRIEVLTRTNKIMLCECNGQIVILVAKNKDVDDLNAKIQSQLNGQ